MAYDAKLKIADLTVGQFLDQIDPPPRQTEARRLVQIFNEVTGFAPRVYSHGMLGWGSYSYTYATGHSGTAFATGFAPRKAEISIYILPGYGDYGPILHRLGKHRAGKSCLYLRHLSDADEGALRALIAFGLADLRTHWPVTPT